jgi:outer membrane protein TolC
MRLSCICFLFFISTATCAQQQVTLEEVIALALQKNYDVLLSKNTATSNKTDMDYSLGAFLPQVNANGAIAWNTNDQKLEFQNTANNREGEAESNNLTASVNAVWTLFDGTRMFATRSRIETISRQGQILVKDQMTNTIASVITNYYNVVQQKQQLNATHEQMTVSEERVKLADRRLQVGVGNKPELLQAKVDYNAQRTLVLQQEAAIVQLKEQLNALTGMSLPAEFDVTDSIAIDLSLDINSLAESVENSNYSLQASKRGMEISHYAVSERRAELLPTLNANAAYNFSETDNTKLLNPFQSVFSRNEGFNYGFSITVPILNGFNTQRQIQQAKITYNRSRLQYEQLRVNVNVALRNAIVNYQNAKEILFVEEENILLAKENVTIALESFKRGIVTNIELRTAQQSLADAYNRLITARYNAKVAETELLRLKGDLLR